jgi:hypothetical protein
MDATHAAITEAATATAYIPKHAISMNLVFEG